MILPRDINPSQSLYFIGANILDVLKVEKETKWDFLSTYNQLRSQISVSMPLYSFALDWLFLIGVIESDDQGNLVYVS